MDKTELRLDPLTRDWTIFNESRALPPSTGTVREDALAESPFRAGLERFAANTLHHSAGEFGWQVRVVPNRLPVLRVEGDSTLQQDGVYEHLDAVGLQRTVAFHAEHRQAIRHHADLPAEFTGGMMKSICRKTLEARAERALSERIVAHGPDGRRERATFIEDRPVFGERVEAQFSLVHGQIDSFS